ncbi:MAG: hypothetical protein COV07_01225 [Candidatus Vogelbacteria bacterium CG10_big_fil_rev_8_21_14_0_10_45_14]|uniref:Uncharacterized protein n=1 Tax=Candidatus Vogelbacteria bacterium CG10_big_fil_rev_8_21_14_0_10_45_14 TaxID=1975042 RepID=A0A2H0RKD2_9BACT|nr:MAG: hypothetical protein COV07_01225 [Candidatus Vogelbacteria bacterium CG10_big_fil_rev_8_21_14_0_10_45_14]
MKNVRQKKQDGALGRFLLQEMSFVRSGATISVFVALLLLSFISPIGGGYESLAVSNNGSSYLAQTGGTGVDDGLVQCGKAEGSMCTLADLVAMIQEIAKWLIKILLPLAALSIAIAGMLILSGAWSPGNIEKGKSIIMDVIIGLVVALAAFVLVKFIFDALGVTGVIFD